MFPRPPQSNLATSPSDLGSSGLPHSATGPISAWDALSAACLDGGRNFRIAPYAATQSGSESIPTHPLEAASDSQECASSSPELLVAAVSVAHDPGQGLKFAAEQMRIAQVGFSAR